VRCSELVADHPEIAEASVGPLFVTPDGVRMPDARFVLDPAARDRRPRRGRPRSRAAPPRAKANSAAAAGAPGRPSRGHICHTAAMSGLFAGTPLERPVTCETCGKPLDACDCPRGADGAVCRPCDQRITVRREKRPGGRTVTVARGFEPVASDLGAMAAALRTRLATGGTTDRDAIEVRGEHVEAVAAFLEERGYRVRRA